MIFESRRYRNLNNFIIPNKYATIKFTNFTIFELFDIYETNDCYMIFDSQGHFYDMNAIYYLENIPNDIKNNQQLITNFDRLVEKLPHIFCNDIINNEKLLKINYDLIIEMRQLNNTNYINNNNTNEHSYFKKDNKIENIIHNQENYQNNNDNTQQNKSYNNQSNTLNKQIHNNIDEIDHKLNNIIHKINNNTYQRPSLSNTNDDEFIIYENTDCISYDYCYIPKPENVSMNDYISQLKSIVNLVDGLIGFNTLGYCKYFIKSKEHCIHKDNCNLYVHKNKLLSTDEFNKNNQIDNTKSNIRVYNEYLKHYDEYSIVKYNQQFINHNKYIYQYNLENEKYDYNLILNEIKVQSVNFKQSIVFQTQGNISNILINDLNLIRSHFMCVIDSSSYLNCYLKNTNIKYDNNDSKFYQVLIIIHEVYLKDDKFKSMIGVLIEFLNRELITYELFLYKQEQILNEQFMNKIQESKYVIFLDQVVSNLITNLVYDCILNNCVVFYYGCNEASLFFNNTKSFIPISINEMVLINKNNLHTYSIIDIIKNDIYNSLIKDIQNTHKRILEDYNVFTKFEKLIDINKYITKVNSIIKKTYKQICIFVIDENDNLINKKYYEYCIHKCNSFDYIYLISNNLNEDNIDKINDMIQSNLKIIYINYQENNLFNFIYNLLFGIANTNVLLIDNNKHYEFKSYNDMYTEFDEMYDKIYKLNEYDQYQLNSNYIITNKYDSPSTFIYSNSNYYHYLNPYKCNSSKDFIINKMVYDK